MSRLVVYAVLALVLALAIASLRTDRSSSVETLVETKAKPPEAAPLCPWREPEADLKLLFPKATRYEVETRILSGLRSELTERLGRAPTGDENALRLYRVYQEQTPLGTVLTRRVKGEHGAIELVLGVGIDECITGLHLQRLREPEPVATAIQDPAWGRSFQGKRADSSWQLGRDISQAPTDARASAEAVVEGARSLLILLAMADHNPAQGPVAVQHH